MNSEPEFDDLDSGSRQLFMEICANPHTRLSRPWMDNQAELFNFNLPRAERDAIQAQLDLITAEKKVQGDILHGLWARMDVLQARIAARDQADSVEA